MQQNIIVVVVIIIIMIHLFCHSRPALQQEQPHNRVDTATFLINSWQSHSSHVNDEKETVRDTLFQSLTFDLQETRHSPQKSISNENGSECCWLIDGRQTDHGHNNQVHSSHFSCHQKNIKKHQKRTATNYKKEKENGEICVGNSFAAKTIHLVHLCLVHFL